MELLDYENKHIEYLLNNANECALFLKRNKEFPLTKPCNIVLIGNGARNTIKGGTGSGDVASRFFSTIEQGLLKSGFNITSKKWLDEYDDFKKITQKEYIKDTKKKAYKSFILPFIYSMGFFEEEKNYDLSCDYDGDACIYVLSRNSGEGNDRRNIKGDVKLSDKEVEDILFLNKKFKKFILVLNVGGVIDLSPINNKVENILLLSQLGVVTGDILASILLGKLNPSGKLSTTWAKPEDYPYFNEFGDLQDTYYKEGIYVGYRYFESLNINVLYPFGYGLSYSDFEIKYISSTLKNNIINIKCNVKNISDFEGKEVVQLYVSKPSNELDNPYIELCNFKKTNNLKKDENEEIELEIDLLKCSSYNSHKAQYVLQKGKYIFSIGNSSRNIKPCVVINNDNEFVVEQLENKCGKTNFEDLVIPSLRTFHLDNTDLYTLDLSNIKTKKVIYKKDIFKDEFISKLSNEDLANICIGHHGNGVSEMIGGSSFHVIGAAGETTLKVKDLNKSLTMSDGPAGIRIKQCYGKDDKGIYDIVLDPMLEKTIKFVPKIIKPFLLPPKNRKGEVIYQYTTAIPIGTALAQSFNADFVKCCGDIIAEEMEIFNIDLWLAPALNIHRNILCGRNFEYYSEDPYLSGIIASSIIKGVESHNGRGTTIKHFACNNQELNRNNNNSHVSERALREIYLKGFEICIKEANPKALMTSYNLLNGIHTSENYELINDILRCEWNYKGLVMSDWIATGRNLCFKCNYPAPYASKNILAGNDLTMPGCNKDYKDIMKALKKNIINRDDLINSASRIYRLIKEKK